MARSEPPATSAEGALLPWRLHAVRLPAGVPVELAPTLEFAGAERIFLFGPSGAGKTLLLEVLAGLRRPAGGRILFAGRDVTSWSPRRRDVAWMAAVPAVYPTLSVGDNLALPLRQRGGTRAEVDDRIAVVSAALGLHGMLQARAGGLGPTLRRRVALGRALVRPDPAVILLDDPFAGLTASERRALQAAVQVLVTAAPVVLATANIDEVLTSGDRVVVLDQCRVLQDGAPQDVVARPRTTALAALLCDPPMNLLPATFRDGAVAVAQARVRCASGAAARLRGRRVELGVRPDELRLVPVSRPNSLIAQLESVEQRGHRKVASMRAEGMTFALTCSADQPLVPGGRYHVELPATPRVYADGELTDG